MSNLITFNNLITKIHYKINKYRDGDKLVSKKEVEDFIYFLKNSNQDELKMFFNIKIIDHF